MLGTGVDPTMICCTNFGEYHNGPQCNKKVKTDLMLLQISVVCALLVV
jgi:hypothetical protein